jgi:dihydrofolate synthase/folylpolyglutamate synthase
VSAYDDTIAWLQRLEVSAGWDLKLDRMRAALAVRGHPERAFPALHVAGTNGKGSTAAMLESVLRAAGHRTGLYTSPHLVDFAERIRAGGATIPHHGVVELVAEARAALEPAGIALTHFEFATLVAFEWFARIGVEVAVVEVGLGGRLDATNVVDAVATAVTSVALDHEEFLGDDLAGIAAEKAGILAPGVPVVVGALPAVADAVVAARAAELGAPLRRAGADGRLVDAAGGLAFDAVPAWDRLVLGLRGAFQRANAEVALGMLAAVQARFPCTPDAVRRGLAETSWPGRLATLQTAPLVVADAAHNPAGVAALCAELPALVDGRRTVLVVAVMHDKPWEEMLRQLTPFADTVVCTQVGRRAVEAAALAAVAGRMRPAVVLADPRQAIARARQLAGADGAVVVTGSLFLIGEAYAAAGRMLFPPWQGWETGARRSPA